MASCLVSCRLHIVWSTKDREPLITPSMQPRLFSYLGTVAEDLGSKPFAIGGVEDHVHLLLALPATLTIAELVQKLKANSSRFMREQTNIPFAWQKRYGAFSVSASHVNATVAYIRNQREHHRKRDYKSEMRAILRKHGIEDEEIFV